MKDIRIPARDGFELAATLFGDGNADTVIVISSATAVPRRFYRHYAEFLVNEGFDVITYDYRGVGESRPKSLKGFDAKMRDWGMLDMAGVVDWAKSEMPADRLFMVAHSVGGQVAGMLDNSEAIDGMVTFSSQSGHWLKQGAEQKIMVGIHAHITLPLLSTFYGYMPWSKLGGEDLPKGAAMEWARWCRSPGYLLDDDSLPLDRYGTFDAPILAYSIEDDKWGTPRSVDAMMGAYPNVQRRHIIPEQHELRGLGHFGYFRPTSAALWPDSVTWLRQLRT